MSGLEARGRGVPVVYSPSCAIGAPLATKSGHCERTGHCGVATHLSCTLRIQWMLLLVLMEEGEAR